ncbi:MAG: AIPR family protein [Ignavibacteria bacterium]|nr:AIPR family protein [Ignavibacteria bacterium]
MERKNFIDLLKRISDSKFNNQNAANISKALGFYFLKRYAETEYDDIDYWNSNVDSANDRGFDFVFFDDSSDSLLKTYFIQCKFSEDGESSINENEVSKTINNYKTFPEIQGNINQKLDSKINEYKIQSQKENMEIEKYGIYINLGVFTKNAKEALERANFEIYDFEKFNSELLLDERLPDINITLKKPSLNYNDSNFLAILSVKEFLNNEIIRNLIETQKIFHYNVRGLMRNRKNSIADDIKNTVKNEPDKLFQRNNGLTIICQSITKDDRLNFTLK